MKASRLISVLSSLLNQPWATFIWGAPGIGKSSIVREVAKMHNLPVIDLRASLLDPTDLRGIPVVKDGVSSWCPPSFLPKEGEAPGILFLDEINAAPPLVQAALYQLILDRRVGEYVLPDGWKIIAAGNRREDKAVTFRLSSALANRFIHLRLEVDLNDWHDWAVIHNINPLVIAFIQTTPKNLIETGSNAEAFATPRSWEMVSDVIGKFGSPAAASDVIPGIVGEGIAMEFLSFVKDSSVMETIDKILANPEKEPIPKNLGKLWVLVSFLASRADEREVREATSKLLLRLPADFAVVVARDVIKRYPAFVKDKGFLSFVAKHGDCFR